MYNSSSTKILGLFCYFTDNIQKSAQTEGIKVKHSPLCVIHLKNFDNSWSLIGVNYLTVQEGVDVIVFI